MTLTTLVGAVAALCTTFAFLPQLFKARNGSSELSSTMLGMYLGGMALWLVYGIAIAAAPVVAANIVSIAIVSAIAIRTSAARRAPGRLRIAVDMDEVMADALDEHLRRYNRAFGTGVTAAALAGRHLEEWVPAEHREALDGMLDASFFADLPVMPDCQAVLRDLARRHDVFIVTAAMDVPVSFDAKFRWLARHFPFIPADRIVFCGDKGIVDADYLIDDRARHFERFKGQPLLFSAPHNAGESRYPRVGSWAEVREFFSRLEAPGARPAAAVAPVSDEPAAAA